MADISKELRDILAAIYGRDVRGSIHDAIDKINKVNEVAIGAGTSYSNGDPGPTLSDGSPNTNYDQAIYINTDDNDLLRCGTVNNVWKWTKVQNIEGNAISSITGPVVDPDDQSGLTDVYTINFTKLQTPKIFKVKNALSIVRIDGPTPDPTIPLKQNFTIVYNVASQNKDFSIYDGNGIASITGPVADPNDPLKKTFTINYTDGTNRTFDIYDGKGITSITGPTTDPNDPLKNTYTINYNDGTNRTFDVYNGKGIVSITGPSTSDLVDTYTITYNDGTTQQYAVTNGNKIYQGTAISGENPGQQVIAPTSGIANARTGDLYNNTAEGAFYHCVIPGDPNTAAWIYDFTISAVATSIDWPNVTNKPLGVANGVATLDGNGMVPLSQLPLNPNVILPVDPSTEPTDEGAIWITTT